MQQIDGGAHSFAGIDLPYFSAPKLPDGGVANIVDETLDVDLGFLANSEYTIFVAERRWADYPIVTGNAYEFVLGTSVATGSESAIGIGCTGVLPNHALQLGYVFFPSYQNGDVIFILDQSCNQVSARAPAVPLPPPAPLSIDTPSYARSVGHEIWINGQAVGSIVDTNPLASAEGGAIGRAFVRTSASRYDARFRGHIAEVVVCDTALIEPDRQSVEDYMRAHWR